LSSRRAVRLLLLALSLVLGLVALGPPSFTWGNDGVHVQHAWAQPAAALAAALSLAGVSLGLRRRALQLAAGLAAVGLAALAAHELAWRLDAVETGLRVRSLVGGTSLRWSEIEAVEPHSGLVLVRGKHGVRLVIGTARFEPDERIRLERTIARRVREAAR
jgi:hypothetical protein